MKFTTFLPLFLATAASVGLASAKDQVGAAGDTITLKQSLPVGKEITQGVIVDQIMTMKLGPQDMKMSIKMKMDMEMAVHPKDGGGKRAVSKYTKATMNMDMGVMKMDFDSEAADDNPFKQLVGKEFTLNYDKNDKIESVEGAEDLLGDLEPGPAATVKQLFGGEQIKSMMDQSLLQVVPDKELKVGDTWPFDVKIPLPQGMGAMNLKGDYTLKGFDDLDGARCAVIGIAGKLEGEIKGDAAGALGMNMKFENAGYKGTIHFDNKLGLPRKSDVMTDMTMKMEGPGGENINANIQQTVINQVTKVEELKK